MKALRWNDLNPLQQQLLAAMESRIKKEQLFGIAVRDMYLQPQMFVVFEDIIKRQFTEEEIAAGMAESVPYTLMGVNVRKGSLIQSEPFLCSQWASKGKALERQRMETKKEHLYN